MSLIKYVFIFSLLASCATVHKGVRLKKGGRGFQVRCPGRIKNKCYIRAQELCARTQKGYKIIKKPRLYYKMTGLPDGKKRPDYYLMTIQCRKSVSNTAADEIDSKAKQIEDLHKLYKKKIITKKEFNNEKKKILAK